MSNPLWFGFGGCPVAQISASLYELLPSLVGFSEAGTQSTPPVYYRNYLLRDITEEIVAGKGAMGKRANAACRAGDFALYWSFSRAPLCRHEAFLHHHGH